MANSSDSKSGGFGLGAVAVIGIVCFAAGYLAASFIPALTGSKVPVVQSHSGASPRHADDREDRGATAEDSAAAPEQPEEKPEQPAAGEGTSPAGEPQKAPTP